MNIQHNESGNKGKFFVEENGEVLAEMTYSKAGDTRIIIDHTEVSDKLRGTGAGKQLVAAAVDHARKHQLKIMPLCPFANSVFNKTPQWGDVLF